MTPMSDLRPQELRQIKTATGDTITAVQKTSLTRDGPQVYYHIQKTSITRDGPQVYYHIQKTSLTRDGPQVYYHSCTENFTNKRWSSGILSDSCKFILQYINEFVGNWI